jgi:hypothetical protein
LIAGGEKPFPVLGADRTVAVAAMLFTGIPLPPQAMATCPLDVAVQTDDPHIPEVNHSSVPGRNKFYILSTASQPIN